MKNSPDIKSYDDLMNEKERLKTLFNDQKQGIRNDLSALKDTFNPVKNVAKSLGNFTSPDKSLGLLNTGLSFALDLILRKFLLKKSGWLVKLAAPFIIKNLLSHFAARKINTEMPELKNVINKMPKTVH
jgi:hypothetical protein